MEIVPVPADSATEPSSTSRMPAGHPTPGTRAAALAIRLAALALAAALVLVFATDWSAWLGARDDQATDDATLQSDLMPLAAKVAGYVASVPVGAFQSVRKGDLLVEMSTGTGNCSV